MKPITDSVVDATQLPARERWKRAYKALATVLQDPEKTDQVLVFSTYANAGSMPDRTVRLSTKAFPFDKTRNTQRDDWKRAARHGTGLFLSEFKKTGADEAVSARQDRAGERPQRFPPLSWTRQASDSPQQIRWERHNRLAVLRFMSSSSLKVGA